MHLAVAFLSAMLDQSPTLGRPGHESRHLALVRIPGSFFQQQRLSANSIAVRFSAGQLTLLEKPALHVAHPTQLGVVFEGRQRWVYCRQLAGPIRPISPVCGLEIDGMCAIGPLLEQPSSSRQPSHSDIHECVVSPSRTGAKKASICKGKIPTIAWLPFWPTSCPSQPVSGHRRRSASA